MASSVARPSRAALPTTLSTALWRPTSSRQTRSCPSASNSPEACSAPVRPKLSWARRRRSGSACRTSRRTRRLDREGVAWVARASKDALPHRPQAALAIMFRRSRSWSKPIPGASETSTTFSSPSSSERHCRIVPMASIDFTTPSVRQNPVASSRSCPGVLMITARLSPWTRISSGSSTTTQSESSRVPPSWTLHRVRDSTGSRGMTCPL